MSEIGGEDDNPSGDFLEFAENQLDENSDAATEGVISFDSVDPQHLYRDPEFLNEEIAWQFDQSGIHDVPADPETQPGYFTVPDQQIGMEAMSVYYSEIMADGTSMRSLFDVGPDEAGSAESRADEHLRYVDILVDRTLEIGGLVRNMERFVDRPVTEVSVDEKSGLVEIDELVIRQEDVQVQRQFHGAVVDYIGALLQHGPGSPEVREAVRSAAMVVQPGLWADPEAQDVAPAQPLYSRDVVRYFTVLMQQPFEEGRNELG